MIELSRAFMCVILILKTTRAYVHYAHHVQNNLGVRTRPNLNPLCSVQGRLLLCGRCTSVTTPHHQTPQPNRSIPTASFVCRLFVCISVCMLVPTLHERVGGYKSNMYSLITSTLPCVCILCAHARTAGKPNDALCAFGE